MARRKKRLEKKRKAREDAWVARAEQLLAKGEDAAFLASVRRRGGEVPDSLAVAYAEVRQRTLRRALEAGDLAAMEAELRHGPLGGQAEKGIGGLAQAMAWFLAGDDEAARRAVAGVEAGVEAGGDHETLRSGISAALGEAGCDDLSAPARDALASFHRLQELHLAALSGRGSGRESLEDPRLDAIRQMIDALVAVRHRDHSPGSGTAAKLVAACVRMRSTAPESATVAAVEPRAAVLAAVIETDRRVRAGGAGAASRAIAGLEAVADRLGLLSQAPPPEAVAVHFALRRRLRRLLEAVLESEGTDGLATLVAARPALAVESALDGRPLESASRLLEAVRLRDPWDRMEPSEFAHRVARLASAETDPLRVAQLMQVELDARVVSLDVFDDDEEDPRRLARDLLERVGQMARSLKRMPPELARETARQLRRDLAELAVRVEARKGWHGPAEQLLVHQPDDPFLLVFAVAGARAEGNVAAFEQLQRRIAETPARKAPLRDVEADLMETLLDGASSESVSTLDVALDATRRLVTPSDWARFRTVAAITLCRSAVSDLCDPDVEEAGYGPVVPFAEWLEDQIQGLSRHLAGEPDYDALLVAMACVTSGGAEAGLRIDGYLASHDDLERVHALYRAVRQAAAVPGGEFLAPRFLPRLAARVVDSIEPDRMQTWLPSLPWLAEDLDADGLERLEQVIEREKEAADEPDLVALLDHLSSVFFEGVSLLHFLPDLLAEPSRPRRRREASSHRRASRDNEDQLELF